MWKKAIIGECLQYEIFWCYDQDCLLFSEENPTVLNKHRNEVDTDIAQDSRLCSKLAIKMLAVIVVASATSWGLMDNSSITTEVIINYKAFFLELCWFSKKLIMLYLIVYWKLLRVCLMWAEFLTKAKEDANWRWLFLFWVIIAICYFVTICFSIFFKFSRQKRVLRRIQKRWYYLYYCWHYLILCFYSWV